MAVVADRPNKDRRSRSLRLGANVILKRPWILVVVVTSSIVAWLFQPERTVSVLAKSFALPPIDVYSDALVRTRGWGAFIFLVLLRWITFGIVVSLMVSRGPSIKQMFVSLGVYCVAALSYAVPLNLGRIFVMSSVDESSSLPALTVIATPFVLVILTRVFTQLLLKSWTIPSLRVGWAVPALSVALWAVGPRLLAAKDITSIGVMMALMLLSIQAVLLVSLMENFRVERK